MNFVARGRVAVLTVHAHMKYIWLSTSSDFKLPLNVSHDVMFGQWLIESDSVIIVTYKIIESAIRKYVRHINLNDT